MLQGPQVERSLDSEGREKIRQEAGGRVLWNIGIGEAVYTVVRKWGSQARQPGFDPSLLLFVGLG